MTEKTFLKDMWDTIREGNLERVKALIEEDREERLRMISVFGSWLHFAAKKGQLGIVKYFVSQGLDVNVYCENVASGFTPILNAVSEGHLEIVHYLLSCGAILDTSESRLNPLFAAAVDGYSEIVKLLIENGIDAKIKYYTENFKNKDALAHAYHWAKDDVVKILRPHSLGEPIFWDGENYTSPILDANLVQLGWKDFDSQGNRIGLWDRSGKERIGD